MRRLGSALLVLLAAALGGCVANDDLTILIVQNNVINEDDCTVPTDLGDLYRPSGRLDLAGGVGYEFFPVVQNGATAVQNDPNANVFVVEGADVELRAGPSQSSIDVIAALAGNTKRTHRFLATVNPGGGIRVVAYLLVDGDQAAGLGPAFDGTGANEVTIIGRSRVFGKIDGSEVASPWFDYPITLCRNCIPATDPPRCTPYQL